ncbi:uncharacterized protein ccdc142 isoform X2 [Plectropomus leopardus]|uniref:uncharacterized protein ccdc142 isoform X2 n=1 Tax=Plectropomus leopardus TaxID=160734 RepID=UPI001C4CC267|nr:uncharacterized protein ccdc142 isoform X2 [Plectropomus leopardus]
MDHNNPEILRDPGGQPALTTGDRENSESICPEKEQRRCNSSTLTEEQTTNGSWSQRSISRSLQRAETLLRSTFNPSLRWLFQGRSQDEEEVEGNFVVAHNLVSRSSARLLRLQQALLTVAPQWQPVSRTPMGSPQVCVKGLPAEGGVLLLPSSSLLQGHYTALWRLLEQRSLLLFIHEYTRRARLSAAFISRVSLLLEEQRKKPQLTLHQTRSSCSSVSVGLSSLSQELRVHLNHWSCLFSKVQSDPYLRPALVRHTRLLLEVKQTLDLVGLQALIVMERYVCVLLSAVAHTELDSVPRDVLEDILAGTELYNQAVGEQRAQHSVTQLRTVLLQQTHYSTQDSVLPNGKDQHPAALSVKELMMIVAAHHADRAANQLHCWASECICHHTCSDDSVSQEAWLRSEWTWEQLQHQPSLQSSSRHICHKTPPADAADLLFDSTIFKNHHSVLAKPTFTFHRPGGSDRDQTSQCQTHTSHSGLAQTSVGALDSVQPNLEQQTSLEKVLQISSPPSSSSQHLSAQLLSGLCQQDQSSVEPLFQVLVSSTDLLAPLVSHTPTPEAATDQLLPSTGTDVMSLSGKTELMVLGAPVTTAADSVEWTSVSAELNKEQTVDGAQQDWAELELTSREEAAMSSGFGRDGNPEEGVSSGAEGTAVEPDCLRWPHSVQWLDLGQSLVFAELLGQYRTLLWTLCSRALWLQLHVPQTGNCAGSINLQDTHRGFQILHRISQASKTVVCRSLGSALRDKCLTGGTQASNSVKLSSMQDGGVMMSVTMEHLLQLPPPLLSSLSCTQLNSRAAGSCSIFPSRLSLQRHTVSLALATVQLSTVWVTSKAYQFLSSWSLNKFLLITQGDLKVLRQSLETMLLQTKTLMVSSDSTQHSTLHTHNQLLLRQQLRALDRAVCELQTFSSMVLRTFSSDCKRMSGEIFEQTMPSAVHWRPSLRTGFPSSPSEYASLAAQTVIGQVLEGVAPLSDDARVQALSITMTAFMEAWMEHILKQKIKFSVQGALQLKQDFDSIREMIQSDKYGLSAELHQRLLSLRVFQQVDSAVVCLLQQPQAKPYLQSRAWEPFTRCCPTNSSRDSRDSIDVVASSITNLRLEGEDLTHTDPTVVTSDLPPVDPSTPGEPYLAPSVALGVTQREWLDLRIHSSARRWRLPGLHCLSKSEP